MISALILPLVIQIPVAPPLPAGCSPAFAEAVLKVEDALEAGDFAKASTLASSLPGQKIHLKWDDSKVPSTLKSQFVEQRDEVVKTWKSSFTELSFDYLPKADISFSFVSSLPANEANPLPPGAVFFFSYDPADTKVESIIALNRSSSFREHGARPNESEPTEPNDVHNEVAYAISNYLGVGPSLATGSFSSRSDQAGSPPSRLTTVEIKTVRQNFIVLSALRKAIVEKKRLAAARPKITIDPSNWDGQPVTQGDPVRFTIQVSNIGNSPLWYRVQPDCGCLAAQFDPIVEEGKSAVVQATINTYDYVGDLKKRFFIYSNDSERPLFDFVVRIKVAPKYKFIAPKGSIIDVTESRKAQIYLVMGPGTELKPGEIRLDGLPGKVTMSPFSGDLADPESEEPAISRKGFKFDIEFAEGLPPGRIPATLIVATDNALFPVLRKTIYLQKGIVALPDQIYFGQIPKDARQASFILSRPEKDFEITSIESESPFFSGTSKPVRGHWEHKVSIVFDGKADFGNLETALIIHTNDPAQPTIRVPIRAVIR